MQGDDVKTTHLTRRGVLGATLSVATAWAAPALAQANWPNKPIRAVVGFPPGGTTDIMARTVAQALSESLGQTVVPENRPGASGNIAVAEVARAAPDGYTLLIAPTSIETANPSLFKASAHPAKDLTPMAAIGRSPMFIVARPMLEANDAKQLVALAKRQPGKLSYASSGSGTLPHLAAELFKQKAGVSAVHVPYRGGAPALHDVMAGQADFMFVLGVVVPHVQAGKVKVLGVSSANRSPLYPEASTLAEQGIKGAEIDTWFGIWVPNGIPAEVKARLEREIGKALALPAVNERFKEVGAEPAYLDASAFRTLLRDETKLLSTLITEHAIKAD